MERRVHGGDCSAVAREVKPKRHQQKHARGLALEADANS